VLLAALGALAGWLLLTAGTIRRFGSSEWFSFRHMPLESLYAVFAPIVVAVALLRLGTWVAPAWVALDAMLRTSPIRRTFQEVRRAFGLPAFRGERGAGRQAPRSSDP
jgi:hypothetical protein